MRVTPLNSVLLRVFHFGWIPLFVVSQVLFLQSVSRYFFWLIILFFGIRTDLFICFICCCLVKALLELLFFFLHVLVVEALHDDGKQEIEREERTKDDQGDEEEDRKGGTRRIHVIVHHRCPAFESQHLEDTHQAYEDVIEIDDVIENDILPIRAIDEVWCASQSPILD